MFPVIFCQVLRKEGQHKESKNGDRKHREMMISIHFRVSRGLSVSHTSHSVTRNTLLLPNLAKNHQPWHSPWLIQVHQLRLSVMLKNTPTRELLFRHWGPFPPLPSLISLDDVFCPLSSDHLDKKMRREKKERKHENKNEKMKRGKMNFLP